MKVLKIILVVFLSIDSSISVNDEHIRHILMSKRLKQNNPEGAVLNLIQRIIGHSQNFIIKFNNNDLNNNEFDTFQLEMDETNKKLVITANSVIAATWGFNYYLKYYCNSSVYWSGKNINLSVNDSLPKVNNKVLITALDYIRYYQNTCTYSYSYVWWDFDRWEYEIDWMALNGINLVYAHTAAEYVWISTYEKLGLKRQYIDNFFTGPAFLAWFRMGNLKSFAGSLTDSWHNDQVNLQRKILQRMDELGIHYILPAFAGFVPNEMAQLYPDSKFLVSSDWCGFGCNYSCVYIVDPADPLFQKIGNLYIQEMISIFGSGHLYSADIFNELTPQSSDLNYLAQINEAIYKSISTVDSDAVWVMQAWLFTSDYWNYDRVKAFLSRVPLGKLILLDLFSELSPRYSKFSSYFGHLFVWNMLHDFGGVNGMFGQISTINFGPDLARIYPNSTMMGIGITMEGINQNEIMYEFLLEKSWRNVLSGLEIKEWIKNYTNRRYFNGMANVSNVIQESFTDIALSIYEYVHYENHNRQLFTIRPNLGLNLENNPFVNTLYTSWKQLVKELDDESDKYSKYSLLFKYDLVDITKEVMRYKFNEQYIKLTSSYYANDLNGFSKNAEIMTELLNDMDVLLASDSHFLLGNWLESAKIKAINDDELAMYDFNARLQVTLWGKNYTTSLFDYASKAWSGLIKDYYLQRWIVFFQLAKESLFNAKSLDQNKLNENLLLNAEIPFITSKTVYPNYTIGDSFAIIREIYDKYRF